MNMDMNTPAPVADGGAAPAPQTPAPENKGGDRTELLNQPAEAPATADFALPDAHKDKPWAKDVKSMDELYAKLDASSDPLAYFDSLKPDSADAYQIPEAFAAEADGIKEMLFEMGMPVELANERVLTAYAAYQQKQMEAATSDEGFVSEMRRVFGDEYKAGAAEVTKMLKSALGEERFELVKAMPNELVGFVYEAMNKVREQYGVTEMKGAPSGNEKATPVSNPDEERMKVMEELTALGRRPHTAAEKQALLDRLNSIQ